MVTILEKINELPGYRIRESHFRIGSKIHVSDFYFAKRFFQNSYFASRLAFLIAKQILLEPPGEEEFKQKGITLIGYGLYSELLLSLIERFLKEKLNNLVNHDIVDDADEPELLRGYEPIHGYVAIIVPIASAFSTSMKIEDSLRSRPRGEFQNKTFLKSHFNVLHVHDPAVATHPLPKFVQGFGWLSEEKNSVTVRPFFADPVENNEIRNERYLIRLPSAWHPVDDCGLCFPRHKPTTEKPLFLSDRSSVTPDLTFTYPKERKKSQTGPFVIKPEHLMHGHLSLSKSHFRYYVKIEEFFRANEKQRRVEKWLKEVRKETLEKNILTDSDRVVIIAPAQFSNAAFVNRVNEVLCSDAATIIHYDPSNDDIQNFQIFYEREFSSNVKVFFVDDTITTGRTFLKTNYFIKHTRPHGMGEEVRGLDGVIVLLDRSSDFVYKNISRKLNAGEQAIFTFAGLHIPLLRLIDNKCPLCFEHDRYVDLANRSYLDATKAQLLRHAGKLVKTDSLVPIPAQDTKIGRSAGRNVKKIDAMFRIVEWFSQGNDLSRVDTFEKWMQSLAEVHPPFKSSFPLPKSDEFINETSAIVLKVMTYSQFTHFKPIRTKLFGWLLKLLDEKVERVREEIKNGTFTDNSLRELKFLMRRAGLLNSNFLISKKFFELLKGMLSQDALDRLRAPSQSVENRENDLQPPSNLPLFADLSTPPENAPIPDWGKLLSKFVIFYVAQVKELCSVSDSRCVRLEGYLRSYESQINGSSPRFQQLVRFLKAENSIVIENFWELVKKQLSPEEIKASNLNLEALYKKFDEHSHHRYQSLKGFLQKNNEGIRDDKELETYLQMSLFFAQENIQGLNLQEKTERIMYGLRSIISQKPPKKGHMLEKKDDEPNNGAFFVVRFRDTDGEIDPNDARSFDRVNHFVAYNRGVNGPISASDIFSSNQAYLGDFFNGIHIPNGKGNKDGEKSEFTASVTELHRDEEGRWFNAYSETKEQVAIGKDFLPDADKLILIRFAAKELVEGEVVDRPQGMVAIYYKKGQKRLFTSNKLRYLLLLRRPISDFISKHHNNAEFRDWVEADKERRIALLTGHGREMLLRFAATDKNQRYFDIVQTILFVQRLIIDHQDESELFLRKQVTPGNGEFSVSGTFKKLYLMKPDAIGMEYANELGEMAAEIFDSELIENKVLLHPVTPIVPDGFGFDFPKKILDMICFELFVNAKKNRWIFDSSDDVLDDGTDRYDVNRIWIEFKRDSVSSAPLVIIENTGPMVDPETAAKIFTSNDIKDYDSVAGTAHIWTLLETFQLGKVCLVQNRLVDDLWKITVTLKLESWHE